MDAMDIKILDCLKKNAREKASDISKEIHLAVSTVIERIRKMESSGLIKAYTIILDEKKMGNDLTVLMEVSLQHPNDYEPFIEMIENNPNVVSCYYMTGDFDFILKIICRSSDELEYLHKTIKGFSGVSATRTHYVLKNVKNSYCTIPSEEGR